MTPRGIPNDGGGPREGLRSGRIPGRRGGTTVARHGSRLLILLLAFAMALTLAPVARGQDPTVVLFAPFYDGLCVSINGVTFPTEPGASIVDISWTWGDGASTSGGFPQAHTYPSIGTYVVVVTATDTNGATGSGSVSVTPTNAPNAVAPILSISPATVIGLSVSINGVTDANTCGPQAVTLSWSWGDGTTTQSFFPASHTYPAAGSYNVCATTMDSRGLSTTQCETVIIINPGQVIQDLIDTVTGMGLQDKVQKSLLPPLNKAIDLLNDDNPNNDAAACEKLDAFRLKVSVWQAIGKLTAAQANQLRQSANAIKASLGCK